VMGTHGRGGLGRLLMGSIAEAVLRRASCPVLTLKMLFPSAAAPAPPPLAEPAHT
jgi:universal stress protein family protein